MTVSETLAAGIIEVEVLQVVFVVELADSMPSRFVYDGVSEVGSINTAIERGIGARQCRTPIAPECNAAWFGGVHHHADNRVLFFIARNGRGVKHGLVV